MLEENTDTPKKNPNEKPKPEGFFKRIFIRMDEAMKAKAEDTSGSNCCSGGKDDGKGGKCC
ncbi:MAG: Uncharacterised protein [Opitutia bacterium UBA7350]|nr:MAG: Uncharacterised protein [Opitutae bacterium UBA7350]